MKDYRRATRKTIIRAYQTRLLKRGEFGFPPDDIHCMGSEIEEIWNTWITVQTGLSPCTGVCLYATTEEEIKDFIARNPVGSVLEGTDAPMSGQIESVRKMIDARRGLDLEAGGIYSPLALDVIFDAGLTSERFGSASDEVLEFLGDKRINELKSNFGENWESAAIFEFCWIKCPSSSPAFAAAAYHYHHFVTGDDFAAGFYWRDMEVMVLEVEENAQKALDARKRAGEGGSKMSTAARNKRRLLLLDKLEKIVASNPDIAELGDEAVSKVALKACVAEDEKLWRQGKGQVREYLGELRRGEVGKVEQERYLALFPEKPPKRF